MKQLSVFIFMFLCAVMIDLTPLNIDEIHTDLIQVYVDGEVENPGVLTLKMYSSAQDALDQAGITEEADTTTINPNQILKDKDVILVPKKKSEEQRQRISINTADLQTLMELPGIGASTAERIIAYRTENGFFQSLEGLMDVKGIGEAKFEKIKDLITL